VQKHDRGTGAAVPDPGGLPIADIDVFQGETVEHLTPANPRGFRV
jgi:hypothetical protein